MMVIIENDFSMIYTSQSVFWWSITVRHNLISTVIRISISVEPIEQD